MIKLWKLSAYICYNLVLFTAHNTSRCLCFGYMWISRLPLLRLNISTASRLWIESTHLGKEISWFCSWLHRTCIKSLPPGWVCTDLLPVLVLCLTGQDLWAWGMHNFLWTGITKSTSLNCISVMQQVLKCCLAISGSIVSNGALICFGDGSKCHCSFPTKLVTCFLTIMLTREYLSSCK